MKKAIKASIFYTIDKEHPDYNCIKQPDRMHEFTDIYHVDTDNYWSEDDMYSRIKEDLKLVAGGGYNWNHVHNISFDFTEVRI